MESDFNKEQLIAEAEAAEALVALSQEDIDMPESSSSNPGTTHGIPQITLSPPLNQAQLIPKPKEFRLNCMNVFCTWPQCDVSRKIVLDKIIKWPLVDWAVVCTENHHETDGLHLHAIIHLKKKCNLHSTDRLDSFTGKPGHYESVRNLKQSVIYVTKDGEYDSHGIDVDKFTEEKKSAKSALVACMIQDGKSIPEVIAAEPGFYLLHSNQIRQFQAEWLAMAQAKSLTGFKQVVMRSGMSSAEVIIGLWLNGNLEKGLKRQLGMPQLYLYGKTSIGKTHMCCQLSTMVKTFWATSCEHFFDGLDESYDLMVFDEFHAQQTITFMNQLLDGQPMALPQKGHQYHKRKNIPIIILSNYSPEDCYRKVYAENREHFDAFSRRLRVVDCQSRIDLWPQHFHRQNAFRL